MEPANHAGYEAWAFDWPSDWIALDATQTTAFKLSICASFIDLLDPARRRCVLAAIEGNAALSSDDDEQVVLVGIGSESNPLSPEQARNRLVFAACLAMPSPLDWQLAEYLAMWSEQAEIPFTEFQAILLKHHVPEPNRT